MERSTVNVILTTWAELRQLIANHSAHGIYLVHWDDTLDFPRTNIYCYVNNVEVKYTQYYTYLYLYENDLQILQ